MIGIKGMYKNAAFALTMAVMCIGTSVSISAQGTSNAEITILGKVSVNRQAARSNTTIASGSIIKTESDSRAVVNLGSRGKIEFAEKSTGSIQYTDSGFAVILTRGMVRVMDAAGINSSVTTRKAAVIADTAQDNSYIVDLGCADGDDEGVIKKDDDDKCVQTYVETFAGVVTMRVGNDDRVIAAGSNDTSGSIQDGCKPCMRPVVAVPFSFGGPLALLFLPALALIPFFLKDDPPKIFETVPTVVSPIL